METSGSTLKISRRFKNIFMAEMHNQDDFLAAICDMALIPTLTIPTIPDPILLMALTISSSRILPMPEPSVPPAVVASVVKPPAEVPKSTIPPIALPILLPKSAKNRHLKQLQLPECLTRA
ncbi:hypothetical protein [Pantoea sp. CCBC3-3-1]|uniref:hypothetical protein n=1 Tax=Pantoea sp. CCBC3-3-1 TaxID=2490851 RepID=UPI00143DFAF2|nr:hypothetical protein [Pantoea sp. CCBC3-3-1]